MEAICKFFIVPCLKGCKDDQGKVNHFTRKDLDHHLEKDCPNRYHRCAYCGEKGAYNEMTGAHDAKCLKKVVPCSNTGCTATMAREDIKEHDCEHTACKFKNMGCNFKSTQENMAAHEQQNDKLHLALAEDTIARLQNRCEEGNDSATLKLTHYSELRANCREFISPFFSSCSGYQVAVGVHVNGDEFIDMVLGDKEYDKNNDSEYSDPGTDSYPADEEETDYEEEEFFCDNTDIVDVNTNIYMSLTGNEDESNNNELVCEDNGDKVDEVVKVTKTDEVTEGEGAEVHKECEAGEVVSDAIMCGGDEGDSDSEDTSSDMDIDEYSTHLSVFVIVKRGDDQTLKWPFVGNITVTLLNQLMDTNHCSRNFTFRSNNSVAGSVIKWMSYFLPHSELAHVHGSTQYLMDDTLCFKVSVQAENI